MRYAAACQVNTVLATPFLNVLTGGEQAGHQVALLPHHV